MDFEPLGKELIEKYYAFTNKFFSYSDINYTSLVSWSTNVSCHLDEKSLFVLFDDYTSDYKILTGISTQPRLFLDNLIKLQRNASNLKIDALPAILLNDPLVGHDIRSQFKTSPDQADYLYSSNNQIDLVGRQYSWHRRKLSIFERSVHDCEVYIKTQLEEVDAPLFNEQWLKWKQVSNPKEPKAIHRYIENYNDLINQYIIIASVNGIKSAFAFCEVVNSRAKELIIHFFKSNPEFPGISNFLFHNIASFAKEKGVHYINFEQDLGEPGLRYYKQELKPDVLLEKYMYDKN